MASFRFPGPSGLDDGSIDSPRLCHTPAIPVSHTTFTAPLSTASRIIIVGAGTFGLSTAFHLLGRGYTNVMVLDRARELPAIDAAGTDINKSACRHRPTA